MRFLIVYLLGVARSGRSKILLLLLLSLVIYSCNKEKNNSDIDNREPISIISEPDSSSYYQGEEPEYSKTVVFSDDLLYSGFYHSRSPVIVTTNNGTILICAQMRTSTDDDDPKTLVCRRSTDNGKTWSDMVLLEELTTTKVYGNQNFVFDKNTGAIHLLYLQVFPASSGNSCTMYQITSTDDGLTWSERKEIPNMVSARWRPLGPCTGIQLVNGVHKGRLFLSGRYINTSGGKGNYGIYSDDGGENWSLGYVSSVENTDGVENETTCVELAETNGDESVIYINSRNEQSSSTSVYRRLDAYSYDSGESLTGYFLRNNYIKTDMCQGSLFRWSSINQGATQNRILFSGLTWGVSDATLSAEKRRRHIGIWSSFDETKTWSVPKRLNDLKAGYSGMTRTSDGYLGVVFEEGEESYYGRISFVRINEAFLNIPLIGAKWDFEEFSAETNIPEGTEIAETYTGGTTRKIKMVGSITTAEGSSVYGQKTALSFDGNSYLKLDDINTWTQFDFNENTSFTLEMILKANSNSKESFLMGRPYTTAYPQWLLKLEADGKVSFRIDDDESYTFIRSAEKVNDNMWHHIGVVRDRDLKKIKIYIDGVLSNYLSDAVNGSIANRRPLYIGGMEDSSNNFTGEIDFVRISPYAKSNIIE